MLSLRQSSVAALTLLLVACGGRTEGLGTGTGPGQGSTSSGGSSGSGSTPVVDGGTGSTFCDGYEIPYCDGGVVRTSCCPATADCAPSESYCDLGGGACVSGTSCDTVDAGPPPTCGAILAADFNQTCGSDEDCTAVYEGSTCGECLCPNAAIAMSALASYEAALASTNPGPSTCACPLLGQPSCSSAGICILKR